MDESSQYTQRYRKALKRRLAWWWLWWIALFFLCAGNALEGLYLLIAGGNFGFTGRLAIVKLILAVPALALWANRPTRSRLLKRDLNRPSHHDFARIVTATDVAQAHANDATASLLRDKALAETERLEAMHGISLPARKAMHAPSRGIWAVAMSGLALLTIIPLYFNMLAPYQQFGVPPTPDPVAAGAPLVASDSSVDTNASPYTDLFERMRAGFQIEDPDEERIDAQLRVYANDPEHLTRVFDRSGRYLHYIVGELERRGMPLEIALLPGIIAEFEPYTYSPNGRTGLWQFSTSMGQRLSLDQNWWYDGRRDVLESTRAALDYLQFMHDEFNGDWLLAIAGYHCGEDCVEQAVRANRAAGRPTDFWNLKLPAEARAYVPKLLAIKRLVANPEAYAITFGAIPNEPYFVRVETGSQIDLRLAAELAGITHEDLFGLNPAFHRWATPPQGPHHLLVPADAAELLRQNLAQLTPDEMLRVTHHVVKPGETLASLSSQFKTEPQAIRSINRLGESPLAVGMGLRVPSNTGELPKRVIDVQLQARD